MKKTLVILGLLFGLFMVVGCVLRPAKSSSEQIQYVKDHEEELVEFVRSYNEGEIHSVQFRWGTADVSIKANGLPQGDGYLFTMHGAFNDRTDTEFLLAIPIDDDGDPELDVMYFLKVPSKDGEYLRDTSFSEQFDYLKNREEALVKFVRSYNEDEIHTVKFDWDTADVSDVVGRGAENSDDSILISGTFDDSEKNKFQIRVWFDNNGNPDLNKIEFTSEPSKNGKTLPEKPTK